MNEDLRLIERFKTGDHNALDTLIQKHQARAYSYAYRLTRDSDVAADVVADAFLRVYRGLPNFNGQSQFSTWLYRILTNCFLDHKKRASNRQAVSLDETLHTDEGDLERQFVDDGTTPHDAAERQQQAETLAAAIERLPEYQRAMIVMFHVEMLSYEQIADQLSLPIGTVKSRLNRARHGLREALQPDEASLLVA